MNETWIRQVAQQEFGATAVRIELVEPGSVRVVVGGMTAFRRGQFTSYLSSRLPAAVDSQLVVGDGGVWRWQDLGDDLWGVILRHGAIASTHGTRDTVDLLSDARQALALLSPKAHLVLRACLRTVLGEAFAPYEPELRWAQWEEKRRAEEFGNGFGRFIESLLAWHTWVGLGRAIKAVAKPFPNGVSLSLADGTPLRGPFVEVMLGMKPNRVARKLVVSGAAKSSGTIRVSGVEVSVLAGDSEEVIAANIRAAVAAHGSAHGITLAEMDRPARVPMISPADSSSFTKTFHDGWDEPKQSRGLLVTNVERESDEDYRARLLKACVGICDERASLLSVVSSGSLDVIGRNIHMPRRGAP